MTTNYLKVMQESLLKKKEVLESIVLASEKQREIVSAEEVDWDAFERSVETKGVLIENLSKLDEGFQTIYDRVKEELEKNKETHKSEIAVMQELIRRITELSAKVETLELRNKSLIEKHFAREHQRIKQSKVGSKVAMEYYQRMNKINMVDPQLMDRKS